MAVLEVIVWELLTIVLRAATGVAVSRGRSFCVTRAEGGAVSCAVVSRGDRSGGLRIGVEGQ